jgi:hypothetical protein
MSKSEISKYLAEIGSRGGKNTAKKLSPERRRAIAIKASRAAAKARKKKVADRRRSE